MNKSGKMSFTGNHSYKKSSDNVDVYGQEVELNNPNIFFRQIFCIYNDFQFIRDKTCILTLCYILAMAAMLVGRLGQRSDTFFKQDASNMIVAKYVFFGAVISEEKLFVKVDGTTTTTTTTDDGRKAIRKAHLSYWVS